jgi:hypothetical protein
LTQSDLNGGNIPSRAPSLCDESLAANIIIEEVEGLIYHLLLSNKILPTGQTLANRDKLRPTAAAGVVQDDLEVLDASANLGHGIRTLVSICIERVKGSTHALGNLPDLGEQSFTMSEDNEDVLALLGSSGGVHEGLSDVDLVHVQVATQNTPEHTFECSHPSTVNCTSDKPVEISVS